MPHGEYTGIGTDYRCANWFFFSLLILSRPVLLIRDVIRTFLTCDSHNTQNTTDNSDNVCVLYPCNPAVGWPVAELLRSRVMKGKGGGTRARVRVYHLLRKPGGGVYAALVRSIHII